MSVTLKQLATSLGLSITTVSRALGGYSDVSQITRQRVLEAAKEMDYRPNPLAQRLQKGKTESIGIVLPGEPGSFADPFFLELLMSMGERLSEEEYDLVVTSASEGHKENKVIRRFVEERRVDGLIVPRTRRQDERISYLLDKQFPFVAYGRTEEARPYAYLDMDCEQAFYIACQRLIQLGHQRIAFIGGEEGAMTVHHRFTGYRIALQEAEIALDSNLIHLENPSEDSGFRLTFELMNSTFPPTAILCVTDRVAMGALHALQELKIQAGSEVSVIGYDNLPMASYSTPPLTTMHHPIRRAGKRLIEMLLNLIRGDSVHDLQEVWQADLMIRKSDGPCPPEA